MLKIYLIINSEPVFKDLCLNNVCLTVNFESNLEDLCSIRLTINFEFGFKDLCSKIYLTKNIESDFEDLC